MSATLFPTNLPERSWAEFPAAGFAEPVAGVIHHGTNPPVCGMPLGGIGTGCLDLEVNGLLGLSSIFNSHVPRRGPMNQPFLGIAVGERTWLLTTVDLRARRGEVALPGAYPARWLDPQNKRADILIAEEIHYWGHYPIADVEYQISAPVKVGLRAWAPFIPGDVSASNTPAAVFEVHLRNESDTEQSGTLAFSFPGPNEVEAGTTRLSRQPTANDPVHGLIVTSDKASYILGAIGDEKVRYGGELGTDAGSWGHIRLALPSATEQSGCSVAVDFVLPPKQEKTVRFVLAWYSPHWKGGGTPASGGNTYTHMYAARYGCAMDVVQFIAINHAFLLQRILAWQAAVLCDQKLPPWLRSDLVNYLNMITEVSLWAQARPPIGDWCRKEDGLFGMIEAPRSCPQVECIPCSFYGNMPLVYFFPELALSTLRGYKAYQYPDGQAPWVFGGVTVGSPFLEMTMPSRGYSYKPMTTLDGPCYVDMVDRLWLQSGRLEVVQEFYESVKKNTIFTMNLRPGSGAAGIVSLPTNNEAYDWVESCDLFGIVPHIGGVHLAQLRMAGRMAEAMGDQEFAARCQQWLKEGSAVMEERTWAGDSYLLYHEVETGKKGNIVMGCQLDGEWMARFHGLTGVFQPDHVETTLATLQRTAIGEACGHGSLVFTQPPASRKVDGEEFDRGYWLGRAIHPPSTMMLAMTYMYNGQREVGMELARQLQTAIMEVGWTWDVPVAFEGGTRARLGGFDYYQNLMFWSLPAAIEGTDLSGPCKPGGLVDRMIQAGRKQDRGPLTKADVGW